MASRTQYPELWRELAAPFDAKEVRTRKQAGREIPYITARTAMNRLDGVIGPENWWDEVVMGEKSVLCRLTLRLPDGSTITKSDVGGYAGMPDEGDDEKAGVSDAFKRAAVKFGVGRYLYGDGVADFTPPAPKDARSYRDFVLDAVAFANQSVDEAARAAGREAAPEDKIDLADFERRLHGWTAVKGIRPKAEATGPMTAEKREAILDGLFAEHGDAMRSEIARMARHAVESYRAKLSPQAPAAERPEAAPTQPQPDDRPPRTGRALFAWTKDQEERHQVGLLKYLNGWAKLQDFPGRMVDWDGDQVEQAHREACRKLKAIASGSGAAYEEALSNG